MAECTDALVGPSSTDAVIRAIAGDVSLTSQSRQRFTEIAAEFVGFVVRRFGITDLRLVTPAMAEAFVRSASSVGPPSVSLRHTRRSVIRLVFRWARELGHAESDPTLDLHLEARVRAPLRPLTTDAVTACRLASVASLGETRLPAAWALAEASARTAELSEIRVGDVDLENGWVALPGGPRLEPRRGFLSEWGRVQVERRVRLLHSRDRRVVYEGSGSPQSRQVSATIAITSTLARAGLARDDGIKPLSLTAWVGQRILSESGRLEVVALRLGLRSLDRTAELIGLDWRNRPEQQ